MISLMLAVALGIVTLAWIFLILFILNQQGDL
jgi:hypothetical protein